MRRSQEAGTKRIYLLLVAAALSAGLFLRVYLLPSQVLVDDEWHSMAFVVGKKLSWIMVNFAVPSGFTSIPLNLYHWILLQTTGWSELLLRLPSILLGVFVLPVGWSLSRRILGDQRAVILTLLLAISPLLIFYTRMSRPYSAVVFFSFAAMLYASRWMQGGGYRNGLAFGVCGVFAVYCHPFAAIAIGILGLMLFLGSLPPFRRKKKGPTVGMTTLLLAGMGLVGALLLLPALLNSMQASFFDVAQQGAIYPRSWLRLASLLSGTANPILAALFWLLVTAGLVDLYRRDRWLAVTITVLLPFQLLGLWIARPHSSHVGIVLARYSMSLLPAILLLAACGLQAGFDRLARRVRLSLLQQGLIATAIAGAFLLAGPLPTMYRAPNQFTNHGAFQHDYGRMDWSQSFDSDFAPADFPFRTAMRTDEISGFYRFLREHPNGRSVVEYPMLIGDHFNPFYFYQFYHQRPLLIGYQWHEEAERQLVGDGVYGNTYIDDVINLVADPTKLRFRNHVDMRDVKAMKARDVEFVILHKQFEAELSRVAPPPQGLLDLLQHYSDTFSLVHEDELVAVYELAE